MRERPIYEIFLTNLFLCGLCSITSCSTKSPKITAEKADPFHWEWVYKEIKRVESPDAKVDAVVVTGDAGATTTRHIFIFLVPHNGKTDEKVDESVIFVGDYVENMNIFWREPKFLEIHYDQARIFKFENNWCSSEVNDYHYLVEIRLFPQKDYSLPLNLRMW